LLVDALEDGDDAEVERLTDSTLHLKPALRLRHWWETTMLATGHAALIKDIGGHSDEVGRAHYTQAEAVVRAAKIPPLRKPKAR
jgi:hypothetical protein